MKRFIFLVCVCFAMLSCSAAQLQQAQDTAASLRGSMDTRIAELREEALINPKAEPQLEAAIKTRDVLEKGIAKASKYITDDGFVAIDQGVKDLSYYLPPGLGLLASGLSGLWLRERRKGQAFNEIVGAIEAAKNTDTQLAKAMDANGTFINSRLSPVSQKILKKRREV